MAWMGEQIKEAARAKGVTLMQLAKSIGVSRQAVNDWVKGGIPKGNHLVALCRQLDLEPGALFSPLDDKVITVPLHRKKGNAKITGAVIKEALEIAKQYEIVFRQVKPGLIQSLRIGEGSEAIARQVAGMLRKMAGVDQGKPMDYLHTFYLLEQLGIIVIFREFPQKIKSYAFHTKIHNNRVIFVNINTNLLDLIFPLLHDAVHCLRDEKDFSEEYDNDEEEFCDQVANHVQFPDDYVKQIYTAIKGLPAGIQINKLKEFSRNNAHSLIGIDNAIRKLHPNHDLVVYSANTNLKKEFPTIGQIIFKNGDPREYVEIMKNLSSRFLELIVDQLSDISDRKLSQLLGFENVLDAKAVRNELRRIK